MIWVVTLDYEVKQVVFGGVEMMNARNVYQTKQEADVWANQHRSRT